MTYFAEPDDNWEEEENIEEVLNKIFADKLLILTAIFNYPETVLSYRAKVGEETIIAKNIDDMVKRIEECFNRLEYAPSLPNNLVIELNNTNIFSALFMAYFIPIKQEQTSTFTTVGLILKGESFDIEVEFDIDFEKLKQSL